MVEQEKIKPTIRSLSLFVVSVSIIAYAWPGISSFLMYDRQAILAGELWRLFTAPVVHFSASHMIWDAVVFGAAGLTIEAAGFRYFWLVCGFAAVIPSMIFFLAVPEIARFGGLSGLATGAVTYLSLSSLCGSKKNKWIWLVILAFIGVKIVIETILGVPLFARPETMPFRPVPLAHGLGCLGALVAIAWSWPDFVPTGHQEAGRCEVGVLPRDPLRT